MWFLKLKNLQLAVFSNHREDLKNANKVKITSFLVVTVIFNCNALFFYYTNARIIQRFINNYTTPQQVKNK